MLDIIIIGLGAHGSSALYHLSKTSNKICGIDRFTPPHNKGSSHGQTRIIRQAYHESPMYVPLVKEAYNLWHELEKSSGEKLLLQTGGIILGDKNASVITGAKLSAKTHKVSYDYLNSEEIKKQFPAFNPAKETVAVVEKNAGILFPEKCIKANIDQAKNNGVALMFNEAVQSINQKNNVIEIVTDKDVYQTKKLIVTAGAWLNDLLPDLHLPLNIKRQVLFWFKNIDAQKQTSLLPNKLPVYIWEYNKGRVFYGFPDLGDGIKIAPHHEGQPIQPSLLSQEVSEDEINNIKMLADKYLNANLQFNYAEVCMYTNTPDKHFIIDFHSSNKNIIIASPCSGHGFKFSSVIGKILCDMATGERVQFDLSPFSIKRFNGKKLMMKFN